MPAKPHAPHPSDALFAGEKPFPVIPACEHFAGSGKLIAKALELQSKLGRVFDITCDCEDGAAAGQEKQHAEMIVEILSSPRNTFSMAGARIHDYTHAHWKKDIDILVGGAGKVLAYLTLPKSTATAQVADVRIVEGPATIKSAPAAAARCVCTDMNDVADIPASTSLAKSGT